MSRLSICIPSHASLADSQQTLSNAKDLASLDGIEVVIGDNSGDLAKRDRWASHSDSNFRFLASPESGAVNNWRFTLGHCTADFTSVLSDDDLLLPLPGFCPDQMDAPTGTIGIRPAMALFHESVGIYKINQFEITAQRAVDRVKAYFQNSGGGNTTLFSAFDTRFLKSVYFETLVNHPTRGGYMDWAIVLGLISTGPLLKCPHLLYVYNNKNWFTQQDIERNVPKTFTDEGLPGDCAQILPAIQAMESFVLIARKQSPICPDEKLEAAHFAVDVFFQTLVKQFGSEDPASGFDLQRWKAVRAILRVTVTPFDRLAASLLIMDLWVPGLSDLYRTYMDQQVDPAVLSQVM
ncbi:hypothetical protein [Limnohabitans sp. 2KL-17]|uniref:hypothetical protein n=1 Tax=Limnohabitans sp. 2KL-17 TaxID=1100704 RepID=UPI0011B22F02|nr:hypothetical protein [Limnohabitans sp. 2KL-17]